jgi:hypothetical protein
LGVVIFAGGLGISLTYGGVSAAAGLAELAKAHAKAVESGREDDIAVTRNAFDIGAQPVLRSLQ